VVVVLCMRAWSLDGDNLESISDVRSDVLVLEPVAYRYQLDRLVLSHILGHTKVLQHLGWRRCASQCHHQRDAPHRERGSHALDDRLDRVVVRHHDHGRALVLVDARRRPVA